MLMLLKLYLKFIFHFRFQLLLLFGILLRFRMVQSSGAIESNKIIPSVDKPDDFDGLASFPLTTVTLTSSFSSTIANCGQIFGVSII